MLVRCAASAVLAAGLLATLGGADWPEFRGPDATGAATEGKLPESWSSSQNLAWKVDLPGRGASSPIVRDGRVYVTCYSGYGTDPGDPGQTANLVRHLLCIDPADGRTIWKADIKTDSPEGGYQGFMTQHGYASSTPAADGERIYVFLGTGGVCAFDLGGKEVWRTPVGKGTDRWGSAGSVCLHENLVIVSAAIESGAVVALTRADGKEVWRCPVPRRSWGTPAVVKTADGKAEIVFSSEGRISGIDPVSGKEVWHCQGIPDYICPSVVAGDGVAYVTGGRSSEILAVKIGGQGDVTDSHVLWRERLGANVPTPVLVGGHLFGISDRGGSAYGLDAETGKVVFNERIAPDQPAVRPAAFQPGRGRGRGGRGGLQMYASLVAADGKVYAVTRSQGTLVFAAQPEFKLLSRNRFDDDGSTFDGTPAISEGRLFLRSNESLYCISEGE